MSTIKAKYAGTCARTGKSYEAGTSITKGAKGWEIAGNAATAGRSIITFKRPLPGSNATETREAVALTDGRLARPYGLKGLKPFYHGACVEAHGYDETRMKAGEMEYLPQFQLKREGGRVVCASCGHEVGVIVGSPEEAQRDAQRYVAQVKPALHLNADGSLSHRLSEDDWARVSQYFTFLNYREQAEIEDDMDNFDTAAMYEEMAKDSRGHWHLRSMDEVPTVEELLGIAPENRRAVLVEKESREEAERAAQRAADRRAAQELKAREEAEKQQRGREFEAFQASELAGLSQTFATIRADFQPLRDFPKGTPGTWYTTGNSYAVATVDGQRVIHCSYGNATCYYAPQSLVDAVLLEDHRAHAAIEGEAAPAARLLALWASYGADVQGGSDTGRLIELLGREALEAAATQPFYAYNPDQKLLQIAPNLRPLTYSGQRYPGKALEARVKELSGGRIHPDSTAYLRFDAEGAPVVEVGERLPHAGRILHVSRFYPLAEFEALAIAHEARCQHLGVSPYVHNTRQSAFLSLLGHGQFERFELVRTPPSAEAPTGRVLARFEARRAVKASAKDPVRWPARPAVPAQEFDVTEMDEAVLEARTAQLEAAQVQEKAAKAIESLRQQATNGQVTDAATLSAVEGAKQLEGHETGGTGSGESTTLEAVTLAFEGGQTRPGFRVHHEWWHVGEDADADSSTTLFDDEDRARDCYAEHTSR